MHTVVGYPIRAVSRRSGLSAHVIRIWEKRYAAVKPYRTPTNRRLYTEQDVERLVLLKQATLAGHNIGNIANVPSEELAALIQRSNVTPKPKKLLSPEDVSELYVQCLIAVEHLDANALDRLLTRASDSLGPTAVTCQVVIPLLNEIGERWYDGRLRVLHEHMLSAVMRGFLGSMAGAFNVPAGAPLLVTCTPAGQLHEFGALMASIVALSEEWRTVYLGPNLPAEEIAETVKRTGAAAVGLSLVYPVGDEQVAAEIARLRTLLDASIPIIIGGRAAESYRSSIDEICAVKVERLDALAGVLASIASPVE